MLDIKTEIVTLMKLSTCDVDLVELEQEYMEAAKKGMDSRKFHPGSAMEVVEDPAELQVSVSSSEFESAVSKDSTIYSARGCFPG